MELCEAEKLRDGPKLPDLDTGKLDPGWIYQLHLHIQLFKW